MKALVGTLNQEKALGVGLLHDYGPSDGPSFQSLDCAADGVVGGGGGSSRPGCGRMWMQNRFQL